MFWFTAGVLRAYLPPSRIQYIIGTPEKVRILATSSSLIPENFRKNLERQMHATIEIEEVNDWDDFLVRCIAQPGYQVILAPRHWKEQLVKQGLVQPWLGIRRLVGQKLDRDFIPNEAEPVFFVPMLWTQLLFITNQKLSSTISKEIRAGTFREMRLIQDEDIVISHVNNWKLDQGALPKNLLISTSEIGREVNLNATEGFLVEVPHTYKDENLATFKNAKEIQEPNSKSLLVYGLYLPKNTPDKASSINLIKEWLNDEESKIYVDENTLASTLKISNDAKTARVKQANYFRDLSFLNLNIQTGHNPYLFSEIVERLGIKTTN